MKNVKTVLKFMFCGVLAIAAFHIGEVCNPDQIATGLSLAVITYVPTLYTGRRVQEYFSELFLKNKTLDKKLVRFMTNIKWRDVMKTLSGSVTLQDYTCGIPTPAGSINFGDTFIEPVKLMVYDEFCPDNIRKTSFSEDMSPGVRNMTSAEHDRELLQYVQKLISLAAEREFWRGFTPAWKTAVATGGNAALTTAGEKTYAAARVTTKLDGVFSKLILNLADSPLVDVQALVIAGTVLTAANIGAELQKVYNAIPDDVLESGEAVIFAPLSVKKFINNANFTAQFRDLFTISGDNYTMFNVPIEFVPLTDNVMTAGRASDYIWGTDLLSDYQSVEVGKVANNADMMFYKVVFSEAAAVVVPTQKVVYLS